MTRKKEITRWISFLQISFLLILQYSNAYVLVPNYSSIKMDFKVSDAYLGLLSGMYIFANGVASFIWSYVSEAKGLKRKQILSLSYFLASILMFLTFMALDAFSFIIFYTLTGLALGAILPLGFSIISDLFESGMRVRIFMLWYMFGGFGITLGLGLGAILGTYFYWRFPILVCSSILILGGAISLLIYEPERGAVELKEVSASEYPYSYVFKLSDLNLLKDTRSNFYVILQGIFGVIPDSVILTWGLQYLIRESKASEVGALIFLSLMGIGSLGGVYVAYLADKLYKKKKIYRPLIASLCSITGTALYVGFFLIPFELNILTNNLIDALYIVFLRLLEDGLVLLAFTIFTTAKLINSAIGPIRDSVLADVNLPEQRAIILSIIIICELFSRSLGIALVGLLSDITNNLRIAIILSMTFLMISGAIWILVGKHYENDILRMKEILRNRSLSTFHKNK